MDIDWRSIAGTVAPLAPKLGAVLGTAIGGPIGATIGGLAGSAIAATFGVEETPEAVGKAIAEDPDAAGKLQQLEAQRGQEILAQAQVKIEELKQQTEQFRIAADDTQNARVVGAQSASMQWGVTLLSAVYTIAFFVILAVVIANTDIIKENPILLLLLGTLTAGQQQIVNYFFGSSAGSKNNADRFATLANAVVEKPNPSPSVVAAITAAKKK